MNRYIGFLRGVNVGGKNKISMPELKAALIECGFSEVTTYINSGNILFSTEASEEKAKEIFEDLIEKRFKLQIPVAIISSADLKQALKHAPTWWGQELEAKHNAILVIPPTTVDEIFTEVGEIKPEYEKVENFGQVIFWSAPIKTFSRTRWSKVVGSSAYEKITIRNANTIKKLAELAGEQEK